jgi:hypothetical protein
MNNDDFIDIIIRENERSYLLDVSLFSDENMKMLDDPYINLSLDNIKLKDIHIKEHKNTTTLANDEYDEKTDINIMTKKTREILTKMSRMHTLKYTYKHPYFMSGVKKMIEYIKKRYNIVNKHIYIYIQNGSSFFTKMGLSENMHSLTYINKRINNMQNNDIIIFDLQVETYETYGKKIIKLIIDYINKVELGNNIVIRHIFFPLNNENKSLIKLYTHCFEKVHIIYARWASNFQNTCTFILKNKINKIPHYEEKSEYILKCENDDEKLERQFCKMLEEFYGVIIQNIYYEIKLQNKLIIIRNHDIDLYAVMNEKIIDKVAKLYNEI